MESEYASNFKRIFATDTIRKSFRDKVQYRLNRRIRENEHQPISIIIGDHVSSDQIAEDRGNEVDEGHLPVGKIIPPHIPLLDLRPTPSPTPRQGSTPTSGIGSEEETDEPPQLVETHPQLIDVGPFPPPKDDIRRVRSRSTQTAASLQEGSKDSQTDQKRRTQSAQKARITFADGASRAKERGRSREPFVAFGLGDRERSTSGKRTFNIKATNGVQVYETAVRAALRKGYPLPHRSHKANLLDKRLGQMVQRLQLGPPRFGIKKSVIFDHY